MKKQFVFFCLFILALQVHAQDSLILKTDSIVVSEVLSPQPIDTNAVALPEPERTDTSEQALLPTHYLFTQRWLWGANANLLSLPLSYPTTTEIRTEII